MGKISIVMGSNSDLPIMQDAISFLKNLDIETETSIISAHRAPDILAYFAKNAIKNGTSVIIAGAGGAAHLPGVIAAFTTLPIIGVPIKSSNSIDGWDSILSILQMPSGVPVATMALNGAKNAGIFAAQIMAVSDVNIRKKLDTFKEELKQKVIDASNALKTK